MSELVALSGIKARTIRHYVQRGLLERPKLRGPATRYGGDVLARLLTIKRLREDGLHIELIAKELGPQRAIGGSTPQSTECSFGPFEEGGSQQRTGQCTDAIRPVNQPTR